MAYQEAPCCAVSCMQEGDAGILLSKKNSDAPYANILESQRAQAGGIEQVLGIYNEWFFEQLLDTVEIESAEFGPAGANDQGV